MRRLTRLAASGIASLALLSCVTPSALAVGNPDAARKAVDYLYEQAKPRLMAGHRLVAKLEPETRRANHNRNYHSLIAQIAKQLGGDLASPRTPSAS